MKKCQSCSSQATFHFTDIVNGHKEEVHLCQNCAEEKQLIQKQELNFPAILQNLIGQHIGQLTDELARLTCPACGIKYMEFRAAGRLGCPQRPVKAIFLLWIIGTAFAFKPEILIQHRRGLIHANRFRSVVRTNNVRHKGKRKVKDKPTSR